MSMEITPTPNECRPKYPKKTRSHSRTNTARRLSGDGMEIEPQFMPSFTKRDLCLARHIIENGMNSMAMQMLGGAPMERESELAKAQERLYRQHQKAYNKLMRMLNCLEYEKNSNRHIKITLSGEIPAPYEDS